MSREIWLGPILNGNRQHLIERCRNLLRSGQGDHFLYLAATKPLLDKVTDELLSGEVGGTAAPLNVFLLSGFSKRILSQARYADTGNSITYRTPIDSEMRPLQSALLARLMATLHESGRLNSLGMLARSSGVVSAVGSLIAEVQHAGISAGEFQNIIRRRAFLEVESIPNDPRSTSTGLQNQTPLSNAESIRKPKLEFDNDVAIVYESYEKILDQYHLTDANRDYLHAVEVLKGEFEKRPMEVPFLAGIKLLIIDGIFDIIPIHRQLLALLIALIPETIINLNEDRRNPRVFDVFRETISKFTNEDNFIEQYNEIHAPVSPGFEYLREKLFNRDTDFDSRAADTVDSNPDVLIFTAPDRLREVRAVAKTIKALVVDRGFATSEIAIVIRNEERYETIVRSVFCDDGIPLAGVERKKLTALPAARAAVKILDAVTSSGGHSDQQLRVNLIASLLKTDFFALGNDDNNPFVSASNQSAELSIPIGADLQSSLPLTADHIESAIIYVGSDLPVDQWLARADQLLTISSYQSDQQELDDKNYLETEEDEELDRGGEESDHRPQRVRFDFPTDLLFQSRIAVESVALILQSIPIHGTAKDLANAFRKALGDLHFGSRINLAVRKAGLDEIPLGQAALDLRVIQGLYRAIDAVVDAGSMSAEVEAEKEMMTCAEFKAELELAMAAQRLVVSTETETGVQLLNVTDMRGLSFRAIFILGLVEGEFPERVRTDWLYPQNERDNFRHLGLALEDISANTFLCKEEHYFYQAVCRARERLYLCRPGVIESGTNTIPSYFIQELINCLNLDHRSFIQISSGFDGENLLEVTNEHELAVSLVRSESRQAIQTKGTTGSQTQVNPEMIAACRQIVHRSHSDQSPILSASAQYKIEIEQRRNKPAFDEYDGLIQDPGLQRLLKVRFQRHTFSPSEFNDYGHCPFRYFLKRVLQLTPAPEAATDLQAIDQGVLLHEILRRFFQGHRGKGLAQLPYNDLINNLNSVAAAVFEQFEHSFPPLNRSLWQIEQQRILGRLEVLLADEIKLQEDLAGEEILPIYFELGFGVTQRNSDPSSTSKTLELERIKTNELERISIRGQIDRVDRSRDGHLIAYDYKSSSGSSVEDMRQGRDVQLGIYLLALEKVFRDRESEEIAGGGYYSLKPGSGRRNNGLYREDLNQYLNIGSRCKSLLPPEVWQAIRDEIEYHIWRAFDGIRVGDFRLLPSLNEETCKFCDYKSICRFDRHRIQPKKRLAVNAQDGMS